ncbi:MAG: hypothetical protein Q4F28_02965 [Eubacteriales bacterium]|nr:hypothetical protein [Eubacteriales bacterium]
MKKYLKVILAIIFAFFIQIFIRIYQVQIPEEVAFVTIEFQEYYGLSAPKIKETIVSTKESNYLVLKEIIENNIYVKNIVQNRSSHDSPLTAYVIYFTETGEKHGKILYTFEIYNDGSIRINGNQVHCLLHTNKHIYRAIEELY